jgi:dipeptidyl-peptidase 4
MNRRLQRCGLAVGVIGLTLLGARALAAQEQAGQLTVRRIYSQPSLGGKLYRGVQWSPDGKRVSFLDDQGRGKEAGTELWALDVQTGEKHLLIGAEKLQTVLPADKSQPSQATGLGRRAVSQYAWAPDGNAILLIGARALALVDLQTQQSKTLFSGQEAIGDVKFSPDGKHVSFVCEHNLHLVRVADGKDQKLTTGGSEEIRKGDLDWVYPEELDLKTAYWWSPDSSRIAFLEMDERKVGKYPLVDFASPEGEADEERYPVAGGANPIVHVYCVEVSSGKTQQMDTGAQTDLYIPRVDWLRDSKRIAIQRLNRPQTQLDLLVADAATGKSSVLLVEKDAYWFNL